MKGWIFGVGAALLAIASPSLVRAEQVEPKPEVLLVETDPWAIVIGADIPAFAMYDDGTVIYRDGDVYRTVRLTTQRRAEVLSVMRFSEKLTDYSGSDATDQPTTSVLLVENGKISGASVYGSLARDQSRSAVPAKVVAAYDLLRKFSEPTATPWLPRTIEVMIWPYDYAPESSIQWPREWPGLKDSATVKRGDSYSIFLPAEHFEELKAFLGTRREKGAVEIGHKKWAVSWRLPFPGVQ